MRRIIDTDLAWACPAGKARFRRALPNGILPTRLGVLAAIRKLESKADDPKYRGAKSRRGQLRNIIEVFSYVLWREEDQNEFEREVKKIEHNRHSWRNRPWATNRKNLDGRITIFADIMGRRFA